MIDEHRHPVLHVDEDAAPEELVAAHVAHVYAARRQHGLGDVGPVPAEQLRLVGRRLRGKLARPARRKVSTHTNPHIVRCRIKLCIGVTTSIRGAASFVIMACDSDVIEEWWNGLMAPCIRAPRKARAAVQSQALDTAFQTAQLTL